MYLEAMTKIADKKCVDCDAMFVRSRTDRTVRCPDCREASRRRRNAAPASEIEAAYLARCEAQIAAMRDRSSIEKRDAYFVAHARYVELRDR